MDTNDLHDDELMVVITGVCGGIYSRKWKRSAGSIDAIRWSLERAIAFNYLTEVAYLKVILPMQREE